MNRRGFLSLLAAAPIAALAPMPKPLRPFPDPATHMSVYFDWAAIERAQRFYQPPPAVAEAISAAFKKGDIITFESTCPDVLLRRFVITADVTADAR